jgi:hypothetical protein
MSGRVVTFSEGTGRPAGHAYCTDACHTAEFKVMKRPAPSTRDWTRIIRGEFLEIPGLHLTRAQIQRLWDLECDACTDVLEALLHERFLQLTADGRYFRNTPRHAAPRVELFRRELAVSR